MSADQPDPEGDAIVDCEGHGAQPATLVCLHLVEAEHGDISMGFHWSADGGEYVANCDACEAECDAEGFFPDALVDENFALICKACLDEIALAHGVTMTPVARTN